MQFMGKFVGGALGFMMGGTLGAVFGVLIGGVFDRALAQHLHQPYQQYFREKRPHIQGAFVKTISCLLGILAKADGRVSELELQYANQVFSDLKLNDDELENAKKWFTTSKNGQVQFVDVVRMLDYLKEKNLFLCKVCLDISYQMAKLDGLSIEKIKLMNSLLSSIGFAPLESIFKPEEFWQYVHAEQMHRQQNYQHETPPKQQQYAPFQAYEILDLQPNASQHDVKKAYRKLMSQYHPDKMMAKGASQREIKEATVKTQQISKAYQQICDLKGW
ncbi:MAG: co-chaperone DjlA [Gammaproteobacteria bacterium]|nr:co-chaperone DjlA [Gammaproteobacteria bacterium]